MPYVYFGFKPRNRGPTKLSVQTSRGDLEPTEPSKIKVYTVSKFVPSFSFLWSVLGLAVTVLSYPRYAYTAFVSEGSRPKAAETTLPFRRPGFAVPFEKGASISETVTQNLEKDGFQSMQYMGRLIWLKEEGTKDDYLNISDLEKVDTTAPVPARFLNPDAFSAYLTLLSLATRITQCFHRLSTKGERFLGQNTTASRAAMDGGFKSLKEIDADPDNAPVVTSPDAKFTKTQAFLNDNQAESVPAAMLLYASSASGIAMANSAAVYNSFEDRMSGFITSGSISSLTSHGLIMKFNHALALPDPNLIGDILGRHFMLCLGDTTDEQFENLHFLKTGLSMLRLTRLGDELTHMFKCIEIAIGCNAGCVPFFSGSVYEGCVVMGGPGAKISINGDVLGFSSLSDLKDEFLSVSDHAAALANISNYFSGLSQKRVKEVKNMVDLRAFCLSLEATQDVRDNIIRIAADLEFGLDSWVVNPANLKACFLLVSDLSTLDSSTHPISRLALFSKDSTLVALSCFGEKSCPTWDIPNGTNCSLAKSSPPSAPSAPRGKSQKGDISDAAWIMVVRYTDLFSATDEFKRMASTLKYRSTSSVIAKKVGHRVFSKDRMGEFWNELRGALRHVNPNALFESAEDISKRKRAGDDGQGPLGSDAKKVKKLAF